MNHIFFRSKIIRKANKILEIFKDPDLLKIKKYKGIPFIGNLKKQSWIKDYNIDLIIDIGANIGQSTLSFDMAFPRTKIVAFEPIPSCYQEIKLKTINKSNIEVYNEGLGDSNGNLFFEENDFSPSSSFLTLSEKHIEAYPITKNSNKIEVKVSTLDSYAKEFEDNNNILLKIDVQGYEDKVLDGATEILKKTKVILIELSFDILYINQPTFDDIYKKLIDKGFVFNGILEQSFNLETGEPIQADCLFLKIN